MAIRVYWDDEEQTTLHMAAIGVWTWHEYGDALTQAHRMMDSAPHDTIDLIIDMRESPLIPSNVLSHLSGLPTLRHPKSGLKIVVGVSAFARALFAAMKRINPQGMSRVVFAYNLDEAHDVLRERRQASPPSEPEPDKAGAR